MIEEHKPKLKVLVATHEKQGKRKNDFCNAVDDEYVCFTFECDGEEVDGACGCRRSFAGFGSRRATTTARVIEVQTTKDEFFKEYKTSMHKAGWKLSDEDLREDSDELLDIANSFAVGSIVEKRGNKIQVRK